jgi:hypothetical protein
MLAIPAGAEAQATIGELAPGTNPFPVCVGPKDFVQFIPNGPYAAPNRGVLTSWSTNAAPGAGQEITFKVLRPFAGDYFVVAHDGPRILTPGTVNSFQISIAVEARDIVALSATNGGTIPSACLFDTPAGAGNEVVEAKKAYGDGETVLTERLLEDFRVNVQATLLEAPKVSSLSVAHGSVTGGTQVTVRGENLARVQSVTFGEVQAKAIENPDGSLTAFSPPRGALGDATVVVKTVVGSATSPQSFRYEGCDVPNLKRKRLAEVKRRLRARGCRLGRVKRLPGRAGRPPKVLRQSPKAGKLLAPGSKVNVTAS